MIDTHTHIQFKIFDKNRNHILKRAKNAGVEKIIAVGTNLESSKKAVELAEKYPEVFASVGIHPHHVFEFLDKPSAISRQLSALEKLIIHPKTVAVGETGLDRHIYKNTKYKNYKITDEFISLQKKNFREQIKLAVKHQKALIIHNRQAVSELLQILEENWDPFLKGRAVFHCCEADKKLLDFALTHQIYIGIDGDITYNREKQEFIKKVPLELIVLETDSPYFIPEPLKSKGFTINEPENLKIIAESIAKLKNESLKTVLKMSSINSTGLFNLS